MWLCYLDLFIRLLCLSLLIAYICICWFSYILLPNYLSCLSFMVLFIKSSDLTLHVKGWSGEIWSLGGRLGEAKRFLLLLRALLSSLRTNANFHFCACYFVGEFYLWPWKIITSYITTPILHYHVQSWWKED